MTVTNTDLLSVWSDFKGNSGIVCVAFYRTTDAMKRRIENCSAISTCQSVTDPM